MRRVFAKTVTRDVRRRQAFVRKQAVDRHAHRQDRRLRVFGEREPIHRAVEDQVAQRLAERGVGLGKRARANLELIGERLAHADRLRALSGEHERDHDGRPAIDCISLLRRSIIWLFAMRDAITTALRTAFTDDRPWPTMQRPATPSSGAPPNSE